MKKSAYIFAASLALATVLSCNRAIEPEEAVTPQPAAEALTFRAVLEQPDTKASLNSDYAVVWEAGDQIAVYNGTEWVSSEPLTDSAIENNGRYATFSVSIAEGDTYYAVYPASAAPSAAVSDDVLAVTLPDVQVIPSGGCVAKDALVQVCKTADKDNMVFKNISSLVEFKAPEALDGYVRFEAFDAEGTALQVAGAASVNAAAPAAVSGNAGKVIVKGNFAAGQNYFAVVYPQSGVSSFRFAFSKEDAANGTLKAFKTGSSAIDLPLNGGKKFSDLGTLKWLGPLSTKADLDKWAKYADYYLAGETVKLGADIDYEGGTWTPVNGNDTNGFAGAIDGQNHSIFGLKFNYSGGPECGFFSQLSSSSKRLRVKDLKLGYDASSSTGYNDTNCVLQVGVSNISVFGALAGVCNNCILDNVHNYVRTILAYASTSTIVFGGLIGETQGECVINNCSNNNIVACTATAVGTYIGGLIGQAGGVTTLNNCINKGDIKRTKVSGTEGTGIIILGGLIGRTANESCGHVFDNCINYGSVTTTANTKPEKLFLGGIIGIDGSSLDENTSLIVKNSRNEGTISCKGTSQANAHGVGGIIGTISYYSKIINCTNLGTIVKNGNFNGVEGKYGGIAGTINNDSALIENCVNGEAGTNKGAVNDIVEQNKNQNQRFGGIVGHGNLGTIRYCKNYGTLTSTNTTAEAQKNYLGGIVGNVTLSKVEFCENYGDIVVEGTTGNHSAGGIVGLQNGSKTPNATGEGCKVVSASITCGVAGNAGLIVGRFSNSVTVSYGTESNPAIVAPGCSVNGTAIDASNYLTYIAGTNYNITASGVASGNNTIWATFAAE